MSYYVDVILPVPLNQKFTYLISKEEYDFIEPGMRVIVPFGKSKLYTSIAFQTHDFYDDNYELKPIIQIIDSVPIVNTYQLKFWDWVSRYYFTFLGDVMRASVPSNLILQSETIITLNPELDINIDNLDEIEYLIIDALNISGHLSINNVSEIINKKNIFSIINSMTKKELIRVDEKIYSKYHPKFVRCIRFNKNFDKKLIKSILKNAKSQIKFYEYFKKLKSTSQVDIKVSDFKEISSGYSSIIKKMVEKQIFERKIKIK